jgi:Uma2 family endonuclease
MEAAEMAEAAPRRMTLAEFLAWDSGDDRPYELIAGIVRAMAPPSLVRQMLVSRFDREIGAALDQRPPCIVLPGAGIQPPHRRDTHYIADLAVTCRPPAPGEHFMPEPILVIEVLSNSTEGNDRVIKLGDYRLIPSMQEIVLVAQDRLYVELHRRLGEDRWLTELLRGTDAVLRLESIGAELGLSRIYAGVPLPPA